jgi:hypothetical protein
VRESSKLVMGRKLFHDLTQHHRKEPIMRATLISFMLATAPAFGSAAYGQVTAADSVTSATEATEAQDGKADVNGVRYHYLLARSGGQTVVLLHGWGSTSYMWRFVMPQLVTKGYTAGAGPARTGRYHQAGHRL